MIDDFEVYSGKHGYLTAHHFVRDALRASVSDLCEELSQSKGEHEWAEAGGGNAQAFMKMASDTVLKMLQDNPPEALINEVRIHLVLRSFKVVWWLFAEEVMESLKLRRETDRSRAYQRWMRISDEFGKKVPRTVTWRSAEELVTEARTRECQVSLELVAQAREAAHLARANESSAFKQLRILSKQMRTHDASDSPVGSPHSYDNHPKEVLQSLTHAATSAAKTAVQDELTHLRQELRETKVRLAHTQHERDLAGTTYIRDLDAGAAVENAQLRREVVQQREQEAELVAQLAAAEHKLASVQANAAQLEKIAAVHNEEVARLKMQQNIAEQQAAREREQKMAAEREAEAVRRRMHEMESSQTQLDRERMRIQNLVRSTRLHAAAAADNAAMGPYATAYEGSPHSSPAGPMHASPLHGSPAHTSPTYGGGAAGYSSPAAQHSANLAHFSRLSIGRASASPPSATTSPEHRDHTSPPMPAHPLHPSPSHAAGSATTYYSASTVRSSPAGGGGGPAGSPSAMYSTAGSNHASPGSEGAGHDKPGPAPQEHAPPTPAPPPSTHLHPSYQPPYPMPHPQAASPGAYSPYGTGAAGPRPAYGPPPHYVGGSNGYPAAPQPSYSPSPMHPPSPQPYAAPPPPPPMHQHQPPAQAPAAQMSPQDMPYGQLQHQYPIVAGALQEMALNQGMRVHVESTPPTPQMAPSGASTPTSYMDASHSGLRNSGSTINLGDSATSFPYRSQ